MTKRLPTNRLESLYFSSTAAQVNVNTGIDSTELRSFKKEWNRRYSPHNSMSPRERSTDRSRSHKGSWVCNVVERTAEVNEPVLSQCDVQKQICSREPRRRTTHPQASVRRLNVNEFSTHPQEKQKEKVDSGNRLNVTDFSTHPQTKQKEKTDSGNRLNVTDFSSNTVSVDLAVNEHESAEFYRRIQQWKRDTKLPGADARPKTAGGEIAYNSDYDYVKSRRTCSFTEDFTLESEGQQVQVCQHLHDDTVSGVKGIVVFVPGVLGGLGPGRKPGMEYDDNAIFVQSGIKLREAGYDCYRVSWTTIAPAEDYAVNSVIEVIYHGIFQARASAGEELKIYLVGHSYGGGIAVEVSRKMSRLVKENMFASGASATIAGVCTLNTAKRLERVDRRSESSPSDGNARRALLIVSEDDEVVHPCSTVAMKDHLRDFIDKVTVLAVPRAKHDLYFHRAQVTDALIKFVAEEI